MALPTPVQAGDIFGFHFPSATAPHAHPGIVLQTYVGDQRAVILKNRGHADKPELQVCLVLMVSHSPPLKGQYGEIIPLHHKNGTALDPLSDIYACYQVFDLAFVPGQEKNIHSVDGPYLGRFSTEALAHYKSQFLAVQTYLKGKSYAPPHGVFVP